MTKKTFTREEIDLAIEEKLNELQNERTNDFGDALWHIVQGLCGGAWIIRKKVQDEFKHNDKTLDILYHENGDIAVVARVGRQTDQITVNDVDWSEN